MTIRRPRACGGSFLALLLLLSVLPASARQRPPTESEKRADALLQAGKWAEAAEAYEEVTRPDPDNGRAWTRAGVALHSAGQYARAVEALRRADALAFNRHTANYLLARAYARLGDREKAFGALADAVKFGFANKQLFEGDAELSALRGDERFREIGLKLEAAARPCAARAEYRAFDFFVGEWEQRNVDGGVVGSSSVSSVLEGCAIREVTVNPGGYAAQSVHYFDPALGKWRQTYADTRAGFSVWVGEFKEGEIRYAGEISGPDGVKKLGRSTYTRVSADRVRQLFEVSGDGGKSWSVAWDGFYVRKK